MIPHPILTATLHCSVLGVGTDVLTEPHHFVSKSACQFTQQANLQNYHAWGGGGGTGDPKSKPKTFTIKTPF